MKKYYVMETQSPTSFRKATAFTAKSLTGAKRIASRLQAFHGTWLHVSDIVTDEGFVIEPLAVKDASGKWHNYI